MILSTSDYLVWNTIQIQINQWLQSLKQGSRATLAADIDKALENQISKDMPRELRLLAKFIHSPDTFFRVKAPSKLLKEALVNDLIKQLKQLCCNVDEVNSEHAAIKLS